MTAPAVTPADLVAECLTGGVRKLLGGVHSLTSSRVVVVCTDSRWVHVRFSAEPGRLPAPWEPDAEPGWLRAPRDAEPGLRDSSADPVLVVVGVGEQQVVAVNALAIDEIGVTCRDRESLIGNWLLQAQIQGAGGDAVCLAGVRLSDSADATVVVADPLVDGVEPGWVDVMAVGTSWPVRPLRIPAKTDTGQEPLPEEVGEPVATGDDEGVLTSGIEINDSDDDLELPAPAGEPENGYEAVTDLGAEPVPVSMTVFGDFEVIDAQGAALQPMQQQIVAAIALLQPIATSQLCQMLYGTERQKSFHVAMSKIRRRGVAPVMNDDGYSIDIDSDWRRFVETAQDPATAPTEQLVTAAELITGELFGGHAPQWAGAVLPTMTGLITAVCRELAARHVDQPETALYYAQRGLLVDPTNTELTEITTMLTEGAFPNDADGGEAS